MKSASLVKIRRARSMHFRTLAESAATVVRLPRYFSNALKWQPFPVSFLAPTVKAIYVFLSRHPWKQSKQDLIHFVAISNGPGGRMKDEEEQQGKTSSSDAPVTAVPSRNEFDFINTIRQRAALDNS